MCQKSSWVCGIYFNITEIKIILFWNICKKPWFHIGISYSCLSIPELNTSQKTELSVEKLGHAFFIILTRILINFFGDIHMSKSSGILEAMACRHAILQHPNRTLLLPKAHGTEKNALPKACAQAASEGERETDRRLAQACQVRHANGIWLTHWSLNNAPTTNFYTDRRAADFIKILSRLSGPEFITAAPLQDNSNILSTSTHALASHAPPSRATLRSSQREISEARCVEENQQKRLSATYFSSVVKISKQPLASIWSSIVRRGTDTLMKEHDLTM